jgi:hypothetical protein
MARLMARGRDERTFERACGQRSRTGGGLQRIEKCAMVDETLDSCDKLQ